MARRSRRQKKQDAYMADQIAEQADGLSNIAGLSETLSGLLQSEATQRTAIAKIQKTQNSLAKTYVTHIKNAVKELGKIPGAYTAAANAMSNQKKKEVQEDKKAKSEMVSGYQRVKNAAIAAVENNTLTRGIKKLMSLPGELSDKFPKTGTAIKGAFAVGAAAATGFFSFIISSLFKFNARIDEVGKAFGFLARGGTGTFYNTLNAAVGETKLIGGNMQDVVSVTKVFSEQFGIGLGEAASMAAETVKLAKGLGISNEEAAKFNGMLTRMYGFTSGQRKDFVDITKNLAVQRGINPGRVMQVMANASVQTQVATGMSAKNLQELALAATDAGIELDGIVEGQMKLLDLQNTFQDEAELNTMLNMIGAKRVNLDKLRMLSAVDTTKALGEQQRLAKQLVSEANRLGIQDRRRQMLLQAGAKAIGLSLKDLMATTKEQNNLGDATQKTADALTDMSTAPLEDQLMGIVGPITKMRLAIQAMMERLGMGIWKKFGNQLMEYANAMVKFTTSEKMDEFVEDVAELAGKIATIIDKIYQFVKDDPVSELKNIASDTFLGTNPAMRSTENLPQQQAAQALRGANLTDEALTPTLGGKDILASQMSVVLEQLKQSVGTEADLIALAREGNLKIPQNAQAIFARRIRKAQNMPIQVSRAMQAAARADLVEAIEAANANLPTLHDLRVGQLAVAQSPNTRVNIQGGADPEVITRASTFGMTGNDEMLETLKKIEEHLLLLTIETTIKGNDLQVILHRQEN